MMWGVETIGFPLIFRNCISRTQDVPALGFLGGRGFTSFYQQSYVNCNRNAIIKEEILEFGAELKRINGQRVHTN